jgi:hypothetical protein
VPDSWNKKPTALKQATTAKAFRKMHTRNTGKPKLPPDGNQMMRVHDVLTLSERPYLGQEESSFKYPKYCKKVPVIYEFF